MGENIQQEEELAFQSGALAQALFGELPFPALIIHRSRRVLAVNAAAETQGVEVGKSCWDTFGKCLSIPDRDRKYFKEHGEAPPGGTHCTFCKAEITLATRERQTIMLVVDGIELETHWVPTGDDTFLYFAVPAPRSTKSPTLAQVQAWFERAQDLAGIGIWEHDPATNRLRWSSGTCQIFGFEAEPENLKMDAFLEFVHPDDREKVVQATEALVKSEGRIPFNVEYRLRRAGDHQERLVTETAQALCDADGAVVRISGIVQDVTEQRRVERELGRRLELEKFISGQMADLVQLDANNVDAGINSAIKKMALFTGAARASVFWSNDVDSELANTHEWCRDPNDSQIEALQSFPAEMFSHYWAALKRHEAVVICRLNDLPAEAIQEREWSEQVGFRPLLFVPMLHEGHLHGAVGVYGEIGTEIDWPTDFVLMIRHTANILTNILVRRSIEKEKQALQIQLSHAHKMEALGMLAGGIAHDMNNVLAGIMAYASLAKDDAASSSENISDMEEILGACERGRSLTRNLLNFARDRRRVPGQIDVDEVIRDVQELLIRTVPRTIEISVEMGTDLPPIDGDQAAIHTALMNVCLNAVDAIDNSGTLNISCTCVSLLNDDLTGYDDVEAGRFVRVAVTDDGCGMSTETVARVFDPFFTTKGDGKGAGLGLSMVYGTVRSHGGLVRVTSEVGVGTTVGLLLPAAARADDVSKPRINVAPTVSATGTILFVDDDEMIRSSGCRALEKLGYDVLLAKNGEEAIEIYRAQGDTIAAVVLDMIMPVMDGADTLAELRHINRGVRVIIASGYSRDEQTEKLAGASVQAFLHKPFEFEQLSSALRQALSEPVNEEN